MLLIAHRGNLRGPVPGRENHPLYLEAALGAGFHVEADVWYVDGRFRLGHDQPDYWTKPDFLLQEGVWCHAKDICALEALVEIGAHCFWHQTDDVTLTSRGYLWTYPGKPLTPRSICVMPETCGQPHPDAFGVCSDHVALAPWIPTLLVNAS